MKTPAESYVVRVYRRGGGKTRGLVGMLEGPRVDGAQAFSGVEELWEILSGQTLVDTGQTRSGVGDDHKHRGG